MKDQKIENCRHTYGLQGNHHQLLILAQLKIFYFFTAHSVCGKKPKTFEIRGQMIKNGFFGSVPKSLTQIGSLSVKNASENISRLGTFKINVKIKKELFSKENLT
jgi:hypothetical protein